MSAVNLVESDDSHHPEPSSSDQAISRETRTALTVSAVFVSVLLLTLPLTYFAPRDPAPTPKATAVPKEEPTKATAPAKSPAPVERVADLPKDARAAVISRVKGLIDQQSYRRAVDVAEAYLAESELARLWALRSTAVDKLQVRREQQLLEELKTIPAWQYKVNRDKYAQLVALNPDEPKYHKKLNHYQEKYQASSKRGK